jgi:hypothetical protein
VKRDAEGVDESTFELKCLKCLDALAGRLNLYKQVRFWERGGANKKGQTLIAIVRTAATTSSEPLSM